MSENPVNSRTGDEMSPQGPVVNWDRVIHKNVRTSDDIGMGKVIAVPDNEQTIIISSQSADDIYKVPRSAVAGFNGAEVQLGIASNSLASYHVEDASAFEAQPSRIFTEMGRTSDEQASGERTVPLVAERLKVSKRRTTQDAKIAKRPVRQKKTARVPVAREKMVIERRRARSRVTDQGPVESEQRINIPLKNEQIEVTKEPYVKEEIIVRKKPITETRRVTDTVLSEKLDLQTSETEE